AAKLRARNVLPDGRTSPSARPRDSAAHGARGGRGRPPVRRSLRQIHVAARSIRILGMPDVHALFADYASYHRTKGNKAFHRIGIPLIMLSLLGMLARVHGAARWSLDAGGIGGVHAL